LQEKRKLWRGKDNSFRILKNTGMKIFTGRVLSKKMDKTATVAVDRVVVHRVYKKRFKTTKKYHVHDDLEVEVGQTVNFIPSKPYSKTKKWKIVGISGSKPNGKAKK